MGKKYEILNCINEVFRNKFTKTEKKIKIVKGTITGAPYKKRPQLKIQLTHPC
jgi:hypothetical protein